MATRGRTAKQSYTYVASVHSCRPGHPCLTAARGRVGSNDHEGGLRRWTVATDITGTLVAKGYQDSGGDGTGTRRPDRGVGQGKRGIEGEDRVDREGR